MSDCGKALVVMTWSMPSTHAMQTPASACAVLLLPSMSPKAQRTSISGSENGAPLAGPMRRSSGAALPVTVCSGTSKASAMPPLSSNASVPSYAASPTFSKDSDDFAHGLNERVSLANIGPGITYYLSLIPDLTR